jgi:hypothetical protein
MDERNLRTWELLRAKIVHEESWAQQRISWFLGTTALLIAAYAVASAIRTDVSIPQTLLRGYLMLLLSLFGLVLTALVLIGLIGSSLAIRAATEEWKKLLPSADEQSRFPVLHPEGAALAFARAAWWGTCIVAVIVWAAILALTVTHI